ncbi:MAG: hypothetical protein RAK25_07200, partial [TACK group archaeon]|nr:hypothetical protein [TACK group archaeon]
IGTSETGEQGTASLTYAFIRKGIAVLSVSADGVVSSATVIVQETNFSLAVYVLPVVFITAIVIAIYIALRHATRSKPMRCGQLTRCGRDAQLLHISVVP